MVTTRGSLTKLIIQLYVSAEQAGYVDCMIIFVRQLVLTISPYLVQISMKATMYAPYAKCMSMYVLTLTCLKSLEYHNGIVCMVHS